MDIVVLANDEGNEISRSVTLTNEQWSILALCADAYATTFRSQQSEFVTTFVTRNQLDQAVEQAAKMNKMLQQLDRIQAKLL
jgi:membrane-bound lytic murein transglycosylase B